MMQDANRETRMPKPSRVAIATGRLTAADYATIRRIASTSGSIAAIRWVRAAYHAIASPAAAADEDGGYARAVRTVDMWR